jgi:hypothetical protein
MGTQQLLLIILGVIIVGVAIAAGIYFFNSVQISSNEDAIMSDLQDCGSDAFSYFQRAKIMGGGNGSYTAWTVPPAYVSNENGTIVASVDASGTFISFLATSIDGYGTISDTLDVHGNLGTPIYSGEFQ